MINRPKLVELVSLHSRRKYSVEASLTLKLLQFSIQRDKESPVFMGFGGYRPLCSQLIGVAC